MPPIQLAQIAGIYRYPVKGLTPEPLPRAALNIGQRSWPTAATPSKTAPQASIRPSRNGCRNRIFLMLMRDEWLVPLKTHFDDASHVLTIRRDGEIVAQGDLETAEGRAAIEQFFASQHAGEIKGPPKILTSPGHSFSDVARKVLSIINLASLRAIENMGRRAGASAAFPRQPLCRGLAGLARGRPGRPNARDRRCAGQDRQTHHPLCRRQCRSRHRRA